MLRQLFGLSPSRGPFPQAPSAKPKAPAPKPKAPAPKPKAPAPKPKAPAPESAPAYPHVRRKPVFEALESRLLLSADPVALLGSDGVLALALSAGDDQAIVERLGASAAGGDIVVVTLGAVTQQYGDEFFGIVRLLIDAGAGDDWLRIIGVTVTTDIIGGLGTDTFEWQQGDSTWSITALDTGRVETVTFTSFEHLVGGDDNQDTFLFAAGAFVSGSVEGGAGGFDSLVIEGGEYRSITYTASGPDAGTIALDGRTIAFGGMEPVTIGAASATLTLNATAGDDVVRLHEAPAAGQTLLDGAHGTFADVAFVNPTASLTISLGAGNDWITIETLDSGFAAALNVSGDGGRDRIEFDGDVATRGHSLFASAERIVVLAGATVRTDVPGGPAGGPVGDITLAAADANTAAPGDADASVTVTDATLIGQNITISASATFTVTTTGLGAQVTIIDGDSTATVAIFGASALTAGGTLTIEVSSFVSAKAYAISPSSGDSPDVAAATVIVDSTAAARIGGAAKLAAAGDLAVEVANEVDAAAAGALATARITLETTALAEDGATLSGQNVRLRAASSAELAATSDAAFADAVAVAELESLTRAGLADRASITAANAVLISASSSDRVATSGPATIELARATSLAFIGGEASVVAGSLAVEAMLAGDGRDSALATRGAFARAAATIDPGADVDVRGENVRVTASARPLTNGRPPEAAGRSDGTGALVGLSVAAAGPDRVERHDGASPLELAAAAALLLPVEPRSGVAGNVAVGPIAGMMIAPNTTAGRAGAFPVVPVTGGDLEARTRQRPAAETGRDAGEGDTAIGASLALSLLKDSVLAELARNVTTSGAIVLSAGGTFSARGRTKSGAGGAEDATGGALEIRSSDAADPVVQAGSEESLLDAGLDGRESVAVYQAGARLAGAGDLVLATVARHDLVAEASGGAERGTGITPAAPIDVLSSDATGEIEVGDTFTLAVLPDAAAEPAASGGADTAGDVRDALGGALGDALDGLALSLATHLPLREFEYFVGGTDPGGAHGAIRAGDDMDALAGERISAVSDMLDPTAFAPADALERDVHDLVRCLDDAATGDRRADGADAAIGENRAAVMAFIGAFATPIAASVGLTRDRSRGDTYARAGGDALRAGALPGYGSRAKVDGRRGAARGGSGWVEDFVNELGLSPEEQFPNAKMRIKA